ncbi:unnamed protein product [Linum tenue]|uniref:Uncharacterized protein n=1 Tax=Linum tenue TaxID=586396 RepID=A0AAV0N3B7_9ROSI|nr:unnamed protein product [Linum tenue]
MSDEKFDCGFEMLQVIYLSSGDDLEQVAAGNPFKFWAFEEYCERARAANGGRSTSFTVRLTREFLEQQLLFGGINFDPLFCTFALYPVAAAAAIAAAQTCTTPLSRIVILSQRDAAEGGRSAADDEARREAWRVMRRTTRPGAAAGLEAWPPT